MDNSTINHQLPRFDEKELKLGGIVGIGSFCTVIEIKNIELLSNLCPDIDCKKRSNIQNKCNSGTRYVLKKVKDRDKERTDRCMQGLVIEARILSSLDHPNIMKLVGVSINDFTNQSFLIMEQLSGTLEDKIVMWRNAESNTNIMSKISKTFFDPKGKKKDIILQKYLVAFHLSSAMEYLHQSGIIHRDLKPDNIGFDAKGQLQLYDFGLAKELDPKESFMMEGKGNYKLTGGTGTMRYMAPEVVTHSPYGLAADVFSFGVILWQIISCTVPYENYSVEMYKKFVVYNGYRLDLNPSWPCSFSDLISRCWSHSSYERPEFDEVKDLLQFDLDSLGWKETTQKEELTHSRGSYISERKLSLRRLIAGTA